jgi:hypothetical protein
MTGVMTEGNRDTRSDELEGGAMAGASLERSRRLVRAHQCHGETSSATLNPFPPGGW